MLLNKSQKVTSLSSFLALSTDVLKPVKHFLISVSGDQWRDSFHEKAADSCSAVQCICLYHTITQCHVFGVLKSCYECSRAELTKELSMQMLKALRWETLTCLKHTLVLIWTMRLSLFHGTSFYIHEKVSLFWDISNTACLTQHLFCWIVNIESNIQMNSFCMYWTSSGKKVYWKCQLCCKNVRITFVKSLTLHRLHSLWNHVVLFQVNRTARMYVFKPWIWCLWNSLVNSG